MPKDEEPPSRPGFWPATLSASLLPAISPEGVGQQLRIQVDDAAGKRETRTFVPEPDEPEHYPGGPCPDCPPDEDEDGAP